MEVLVRSGQDVRRATATGRDIYAITAPLVVEAALRVTEGLVKKVGVVSPGDVFDATDFLQSLPPEYLAIAIKDNDDIGMSKGGRPVFIKRDEEPCY